MAPVFPWCSSSPSDEKCDIGIPVLLNVYDLTPANNVMIWFGLGLFHSGIEVHGLEYGFGAHDYPTTGVFKVEPKRCPGFVYRCSIPLGRINMRLSEFREFMEDMAEYYHGDTYHLISKNCNHFTKDICLRLTGKLIPSWVNRMAHLGNVCCCVVPGNLPTSTAKRRNGYYGSSDDPSGAFSTISALEPLGSDDADKDRLILSATSSEGEATFIILGR